MDLSRPTAMSRGSRRRVGRSGSPLPRDEDWTTFSERALAKALRYSWERSAESFEQVLVSGQGVAA